VLKGIKNLKMGWFQQHTQKRNTMHRLQPNNRKWVKNEKEARKREGERECVTQNTRVGYYRL
jgi:hypothetical protein